MNLRPLLFVVLAAAILAGLFLWLRPVPQTAAPADTAPAAASAVPAVPINVFELKLQGGRRVSGPDIIRVRQGETLTLRVTADAADELHLHGYDSLLKLQPGQTAELTLQAEHAGRFEFELHHAHREIGVLEVQPR
jgi:FtsP/CotA-like multicopper oxidase with cupredoxin domain